MSKQSTTVAFKLGDVVRLRDQTAYNGKWHGPMSVTHIYHELPRVIRASHPQRAAGAFRVDELEPYVEPRKLKVGDKVRNVSDGAANWYGEGAAVGTVYTVARVREGSSGQQYIQLEEMRAIHPSHMRDAANYDLVEVPQFQVGERVTILRKWTNTESAIAWVRLMDKSIGCQGVVTRHGVSHDGGAYVHVKVGGDGVDWAYAPCVLERVQATSPVPPEADEADEPKPSDFRIRRRGGTEEIRGTSYKSKDEARKAAERYVAGVYEVVRVVVEDVIKVERVTRVVDYQEAA